MSRTESTRNLKLPCNTGLIGQHHLLATAAPHKVR
jgi:hypothetical protein